MKKRLLNILLTGTVIMGLLAGCSSSSAANDSQNESNQTSDQASNQTVDQTADGKVLVVYYSATGYTENVANAIAEATGGDIFELVPVDGYTNDELDWRNNDSRVSVEHNNVDQRKVELASTSVENWDSYDTVFIGYPIWWGIAAWPVDSFVTTNDFTGKTVIPFCTATSSGIGQSGELLAEMSGTGDWQEGERFRSNVSADSVKEWVEGLTY